MLLLPLCTLFIRSLLHRPVWCRLPFSVQALLPMVWLLFLLLFCSAASSSMKSLDRIGFCSLIDCFGFFPQDIFVILRLSRMKSPLLFVFSRHDSTDRNFFAHSYVLESGLMLWICL